MYCLAKYDGRSCVGVQLSCIDMTIVFIDQMFTLQLLLYIRKQVREQNENHKTNKWNTTRNRGSRDAVTRQKG